MKIGLYFLENAGNSWNMSNGVLAALERMGHSAISCVQERGEEPERDWKNFDLDFALILEAEYVPIPKYEGLKCPKALWFTETDYRVDLAYDYPSRIAKADHCFFVGIQDAKKYGAVWLPHGCDTEIFKPYPVPKTIGIGYYGSLYARRLKLWDAIQRVGIPVTPIERVGGSRKASFSMLARQISQCRVILALPSYSHSFTTRPTECFACDVPIVVPRLPAFARDNELQWNVAPVYYDENDLDSLGDALVRATQIQAGAARQEVQTGHRLEMRLQKIIEVMTCKS